MGHSVSRCEMDDSTALGLRQGRLQEKSSVFKTGNLMGDIGPRQLTEYGRFLGQILGGINKPM